MATSASDLLDATNDAITACLQSQSYSLRGRQQQRAKLIELMEFRKALLDEVQQANSGGIMASLAQPMAVK